MLSPSPIDQLECFIPSSSVNKPSSVQHPISNRDKLEHGPTHYTLSNSRVQNSQHRRYNGTNTVGRYQGNMPQYVSLDPTTDFESFVNKQYSALFSQTGPSLFPSEQASRDFNPISYDSLMTSAVSDKGHDSSHLWTRGPGKVVEASAPSRNVLYSQNQTLDNKVNKMNYSQVGPGYNSSVIRTASGVGETGARSMDELFTSYLINGNSGKNCQAEPSSSYVCPGGNASSCGYSAISTRIENVRSISALQTRPTSLPLKATSTHDYKARPFSNTRSENLAFTTVCTVTKTTFKASKGDLESPLSLGTLLSPSPSYHTSHQNDFLGAPPPLSPQGTLKTMSQVNQKVRRQSGVRQLLNSPPPPVEHAWLVPKTHQLMPDSKQNKSPSTHSISVSAQTIPSPAAQSPLSSHLPQLSFGLSGSEKHKKSPSFNFETSSYQNLSAHPMKGCSTLSSDSESDRFGSPPPLYPSLTLSPSIHQLPATPQNLQFLDSFKYPFNDNVGIKKGDSPLSPFKMLPSKPRTSEKGCTSLKSPGSYARTSTDVTTVGITSPAKQTQVGTRVGTVVVSRRGEAITPLPANDPRLRSSKTPPVLEGNYPRMSTIKESVVRTTEDCDSIITRRPSTTNLKSRYEICSPADDNLQFSSCNASTSLSPANCDSRGPPNLEKRNPAHYVKESWNKGQLRDTTSNSTARISGVINKKVSSSSVKESKEPLERPSSNNDNHTPVSLSDLCAVTQTMSTTFNGSLEKSVTSIATNTSSVSAHVGKGEGLHVSENMKEDMYNLQNTNEAKKVIEKQNEQSLPRNAGLVLYRSAKTSDESDREHRNSETRCSCPDPSWIGDNNDVKKCRNCKLRIKEGETTGDKKKKRKRKIKEHTEAIKIGDNKSVIMPLDQKLYSDVKEKKKKRRKNVLRDDKSTESLNRMNISEKHSNVSVSIAKADTVDNRRPKKGEAKAEAAPVVVSSVSTSEIVTSPLVNKECIFWIPSPCFIPNANNSVAAKGTEATSKAGITATENTSSSANGAPLTGTVFTATSPGFFVIRSPSGEPSSVLALPPTAVNKGKSELSPGTPSLSPTSPQLLLIKQPLSSVAASPNESQGSPTTKPLCPNNLVFVRSPDGSGKLYQSVVHVIPTTQQTNLPKDQSNGPQPATKLLLFPAAGHKVVTHEGATNTEKFQGRTPTTHGSVTQINVHQNKMPNGSDLGGGKVPSPELGNVKKHTEAVSQISNSTVAITKGLDDFDSNTGKSKSVIASCSNDAKDKLDCSFGSTPKHSPNTLTNIVDGNVKSPLSGNLFDSLFRGTSVNSDDEQEDGRRSFVPSEDSLKARKVYQSSSIEQHVENKNIEMKCLSGEGKPLSNSFVYEGVKTGTLYSEGASLTRSPKGNKSSSQSGVAAMSQRAVESTCSSIWNSKPLDVDVGASDVRTSTRKPAKLQMDTNLGQETKLFSSSIETSGEKCDDEANSNEIIIINDDISEDTTFSHSSTCDVSGVENTAKLHCKQRSVREERAIRYAMMQFEIMEKKRIRKERRQKKLDAKAKNEKRRILKKKEAQISGKEQERVSSDVSTPITNRCKGNGKKFSNVTLPEPGYNVLQRAEVRKSFSLRKSSKLKKLKNTKKRFEKKLKERREKKLEEKYVEQKQEEKKNCSYYEEPSTVKHEVLSEDIDENALKAASLRNKSYLLVPSYNGFLDFSPVIVESRTRSQATVEDKRRFEKPKLPVLVIEQLGEQKKEILVEDGQHIKETLAKESILSEIPKTENRKDLKKLSYNRTTGETPLHKAARRGYADVVELCIADGADLDAKDNAGWTALHEACSKGHSEVVRILLRYGANPNCCSESGVRPIHDAAEGRNLTIMRLLLSYGADPLLTTYSGLTTMDCLKSPGAKEFLKDFLIDKQLTEIHHDNKEYVKGSWKFEGSSTALEDEDSASYDIFEDIPLGTDPQASFETSREPHVPLYRLPLRENSQVIGFRNYYILEDILKRIKQPRTAFFKRHKVELRQMLWDDFCAELKRNEITTRPEESRPDGPRSKRMVELVHIGPYAARKMFNCKNFTC